MLWKKFFNDGTKKVAMVLKKFYSDNTRNVSSKGLNISLIKGLKKVT